MQAIDLGVILEGEWFGPLFFPFFFLLRKFGRNSKRWVSALKQIKNKKIKKKVSEWNLKEEK